MLEAALKFLSRLQGRCVMSDSERPSGMEKAAAQVAVGAAGAAVGAMTHKAVKPTPGSPGGFAMQVGSAMGAAASNGKGVQGALAAGGAIVTAKVAAGVAVATAAAPFVLGAAAVGVVGYGLYQLFKSDEKS